MTTDTTALQERIARAMWDHDNAHMSQQWRDMAWDDMGGSEPSDERIAYLLRATAVLPIIAAEVERLHSWEGLMSLLDEHWPESMIPTLSDDVSRDPGPRIVSLLRWVEALRAQVERVREALFASDDGTEYEHDRDHGQAEGYPDCPGCWVETIRRALDGEVEA